MKPCLALTRQNVQRFLWMNAMLGSMTGGRVYTSIHREGFALQLVSAKDIGSFIVHAGSEGAITADVPDTATDDEAEAILLEFVAQLPEPKK